MFIFILDSLCIFLFSFYFVSFTYCHFFLLKTSNILTRNYVNFIPFYTIYSYFLLLKIENREMWNNYFYKKIKYIKKLQKRIVKHTLQSILRKEVGFGQRLSYGVFRVHLRLFCFKTDFIMSTFCWDFLRLVRITLV